MLKQTIPFNLLCLVSLFCALSLSAVVNTAAAQMPTPQSSQVTATPEPPQVNASSYILMDFHSGHVLASDNPNLQVEPASITKMMTAYVVFSEIKSGNLSLEDMITVS